MVKEQHPPVPQRGLGLLQLTEVTAISARRSSANGHGRGANASSSRLMRMVSIMAAMQARPDLI
jgi:hypothetical protein